MKRKTHAESFGSTHHLVSSSIDETLRDRRFFSSSQRHGFAAENANHVIDKVLGRDAKLIGGDNLKNGADRFVDGINIQSKYCRTASDTLNSAFDSNGSYKYLNADGTPMQLEVPKDQYQEALLQLEEKILKGKVHGVKNPNDAKKIIREGHLTYEQSVNVAKAGTVESLTYDAVTGTVVAAQAFGLSAAVSFALAIYNGESVKEALETACYTGIKVGGVALLQHIAVSQLARTAIVKSVAIELATYFGNSSHAVKIESAINKNVIPGVITVVILSAPEIKYFFSNEISGGQLIKNILKIISGVVGGSAGTTVGASVGAAVGPVGSFIGGFAGSVIGGFVGTYATGIIIDGVIDDDALELLLILEKTVVSEAEYLVLAKSELSLLMSRINSIDSETVRKMYKSSNKEVLAKEIVYSFSEEIVSNRPKIVMPSEQEIAEASYTVMHKIMMQDIDYRMNITSTEIDDAFLGVSQDIEGRFK